MDTNGDNRLLKVLRVLTIVSAFVFTILYIPGFMFPGSFPRTVFLYIATSIILIAWLAYFYKHKEISFNNNWLTKAIFGYFLVLLISGSVGGHFENSFFGTFGRMTGIVTMLYISSLYLVTSSVFRPRDWTYLLRSLLASSVIVALISFLGMNGLNLPVFNFLDQGGSLFSNNTLSGLFYLFPIFFGLILLVNEKSTKWRIFYIMAMLAVLLNPDVFNFEIWQDPGLLKDVFHNPMIILGQARASSIAVFFGILVSGLFYLIHKIQKFSMKTKGLLYGSIFLIIILVSICFVWSVEVQKGFGHNFLLAQNDFQRPLSWQHGLEGFAKKPVLGYGPNNFKYAYQDTMKPDLLFINGDKWFDKPHNGLIEVLVETGVLGVLAWAAIFTITCFYGFRLYRRANDFSVPIAILLIVLNMVQTQTSFNTITSLLMTYLLLAYVSSREPKMALYSISSNIKRKSVFFLGSAVVLFSIVFTAIIPASNSHQLVSAMSSGKFEKRMQLYEKLKSFYGYPADPLYEVYEKYTNALLDIAATSPDAKLVQEKASLEYNALLDTFESHYIQYHNDLRYLLNYVNTIYLARLFGVDRMNRAGELIPEIKQLSTQAPQVFWLSSLYAKYTGDEDMAFAEIQKAAGLFDSIESKYPEEQLGEFHIITLNIKAFLEQTKGSKAKLYFHLSRV